MTYQPDIIEENPVTITAESSRAKTASPEAITGIGTGGVHPYHPPVLYVGASAKSNPVYFVKGAIPKERRAAAETENHP